MSLVIVVKNLTPTKMCFWSSYIVYHKYLMFINEFLNIVNICARILQNIYRDRRNGRIHWNAHIKLIYRKKHRWNCMARLGIEPGTPASLVTLSTTELSKPINIYGPSRPNYHIPPPLTKFLPSMKHINKCSLCQDLLI